MSFNRASSEQYDFFLWFVLKMKYTECLMFVFSFFLTAQRFSENEEDWIPSLLLYLTNLQYLFESQIW